MSWLAALERRSLSAGAERAPVVGGQGPAWAETLKREKAKKEGGEEAAAAGGLEGDTGRGVFCQEVMEMLHRVCQPKWREIPDPDSEEWKRRFEEKLSAFESTAFSEDANCEEAGQPSEAKPPCPSGFEKLTAGDEFLLLSRVLGRLECPFAAARRRLRAVAEAEASRPLTPDKVVEYAFRLAATTSAPPESTNTSDALAHNALFPQYHFLPYPSTEEIQNSVLTRLAAKPYGEVCFPPRVLPKLVSREELASSLKRQFQFHADSPVSAGEAALIKEAARFPEDEMAGGAFPVECLDTRLLREEEGACAPERRFFFLVKATCSTPCVSFWFELSAPGSPDKFADKRGSARRQWTPASPLVVPGPFPRLLKVGCAKPGKRDSRAAHVKLLLKGGAAAAEAQRGAEEVKRDEKNIPANQPPHRDAASTSETTAQPPPASAFPKSASSSSEAAQGSSSASAAGGGERKSQFSGLMLGATRRTHRRRRASSSSSETSGASSEDN